VPITDPLDITGCVVWLDPGTISATDGDPVGTWSDQSGNTNDATSSLTDRPTYRDGTDYYHAQPTLEFSTQAHRLEIAADATLNNGQVTYALVCRLDDIEAHADPKWLVNKVNTQPSTIGIRVADEGIANEGLYEVFFRLNGTETTVRTIASRGPVRQAWTVILFRYDGTTGELYIDDKLSGSLSQSGAIDTDSSGALHIGNHNSSDLGWEGQIGDVVVYNKSLSNTERDDLIDWLLDKYKNSEYVKVSSILSSGIRHARIRSATDTGKSGHQMLVVTTSGAINHYTSTTSAPHTWTLQNSGVIPTDASYRTLDFVVVNNTWYVYVDRATGNGSIELWTGSDVTSLTEHASSPVISGSAGDYPRTMGVIEESGSWTMLVDVRTDSITGNVGYIDRWTSANGTSWTKDTTNSPVLSPTGTGFEGGDVGHPMIYKVRSGEYLVVYAGFNENHPLASSEFPHEIGLLTSSDLITFTRSNKNPILTNSQGSTDFDTSYVANPCLFNDGERLALYYDGDTPTTSQQLGYALGPLANQTVTDTLTLSDEGEPSIKFVSGSNTLSLTDTASGTIPQVIERSVTDTITCVDTGRASIRYLSVTDTLTITDPYTYGQPWHRDLEDDLSGEGEETFDPDTLEFTTTYTLTDVAVANYGLPLPILQGLSFSETVSRVVQRPDAIEGLAEDTLSITDAAVISTELSASDTLILSQSVTVHQGVELVDELELSDEASANVVYSSLLGSDTIPLSDAVAYILEGDELCDYTLFVGGSSDPDAPTPPPTSYPAAGGTPGFRLQYPASGLVTDELLLRSPNLGDKDRLSFSRINRETRGGTLIVYADPVWPKVETLALSFSGLSDTEAQDLLTFMEAHLGEDIKLIDWEDRAWTGVISEPQDPIVQDGRGCQFTASFEFQGTKD
jgi:hypothetical protein